MNVFSFAKHRASWGWKPSNSDDVRQDSANRSQSAATKQSAPETIKTSWGTADMTAKMLDMIKEQQDSKEFSKLRHIAFTLCSIALSFIVGQQALGQVDELPSAKFVDGVLISPSTANTYFNSSISTLGRTQSNELIELAIGLGANRLSNSEYIQNVFDYVYANIDLNPVFGLQKGAQGAMLDQSGTAFDQAHLMMELLREGNISGASYQYGTVSLTENQFKDYFQIDTVIAGCELLANGGIPAQVPGVGSTGNCDSANSLTITMSHIWLEINGVVYDPALKVHKSYDGLPNLSNRLGCGTNGCADEILASSLGVTGNANLSGGMVAPTIQNISKTGLESRLKTAAAALEANLEVNYKFAELEEIIGGYNVDLELIPHNGSQPVSARIGATWSNIPDQYRTTIRVRFDSIDVPLFVDEIYGKWMMLLGGFVSDEDGQISVQDALGNQTTYPTPCTTNNPCREVYLVMNGVVLGASRRFDIVGNNSAILTMEVNHPYAANEGQYADEYWSRETYADHLININDVSQREFTDLAIIHGWGDTGTTLYNRYSSPPLITVSGDDPLGVGFYIVKRRLSNGTLGGVPIRGDLVVHGYRWQVDTSKTAKVIDQLASTRHQHHHSLGYVLSGTQIGNVSATTIFHAEPMVSNTSNSNTIGQEEEIQSASRLYALMATAHEGGIFQRSLNTILSPSPLPAIGESNKKSEQFILLDASNYSFASSYLNEYSTGRRAILKSYVDDGYSILLPKDGEIDQIFNGNIDWEAATFVAIKDENLAYVLTSDLFDGRAHRIKGGGAGAISNPVQSTINTLNTAGNPDNWKLGSLNLATGLGPIQHPNYYLKTGGGDFPYSLSEGPNPIWKASATFGSDLSQGLGEDSALDAVHSIAALFTLKDLLKGDLSAKDLLVSAMVSNWWQQKLFHNIVQISGPQSQRVFVRRVNGGFNPPDGINAELIQHGDAYDDLTARYNDTSVLSSQKLEIGYNRVSLALHLNDGSRQTFIVPTFPRNLIKARIHSWDFPTGMSVFYDYDECVSCAAGGLAFSDVAPLAYDLRAVRNNIDRKIRFIIPLTGLDVLGGVCLGNSPCSPGRNIQLTDHISTSLRGLGIEDIYTNNFPIFTADLSQPSVLGRRFDDTGRSRAIVSDSAGNIYNRVGIDGITPIAFGASSLALSAAWTVPVSGGADTVFHAGTIGYRGYGEQSPSYTVVADGLCRGSCRVREYIDGEGRSTKLFIGGVSTERYRRSELLLHNGTSIVRYYDRNQNQLSITDPLNRTTLAEYDSLNRLISSTNPEGIRTEIIYDAKHNPIKVTIKAKPGTNEVDIVQSATYGDINTTIPQSSFSLPEISNNTTASVLLTSTDGNGAITDYTYYPGTGLLHERIEPLVSGGRPVTTYEYTSTSSDAPGLLKRMIDPANPTDPTSSTGLITEYTYDDKGNITSTIVDPLGESLRTVFFYDSLGNRCRTIDSRGSSGLTGGYDPACDAN
jgi:YD repeat-containing protein